MDDVLVSWSLLKKKKLTGLLYIIPLITQLITKGKQNIFI